MKNYKLLLSICAIAILVAFATVNAYASNQNKINDKKDSKITEEVSEKANDKIKEDRQQKEKTNPLPNNEVKQKSVYDQYRDKAKNKDEKDKIDQIEKKSIPFAGAEFNRELKQAIGELQKDQKRVSKDEVKAILKANSSRADVLKKINDIHGAPDYEGGSGMTTIHYFLDDQGKSEFVFLGDSESSPVVLRTTDAAGNSSTTLLSQDGSERAMPSASSAPVK